MRLTNVLYKVNYHRHFQRIWKRQGKFEVKELIIPPELQAMEVQIKDAKEILHETKMFKPPNDKKSGLPYPLPPSVLTQEMQYYRMHSGIQMTEGENQALALTKTTPYKGLPKQINNLIGLESLPEQDELVQTNILQAQIWDAMQDKLPKIVDPNKPGYVFKRAYGILHEKKVASSLEKLSYLCDLATGKYSGCFNRSKLQNAFCEISIKRGNCDVAFQMESDILMKAKKALPAFASPSEVKETEEQPLPNIYPVKPILDLDKCEESPLGDHIISVQYDSSFGNIHTLLVAQKLKDLWSPSEQSARAIATCFAFAAAEARFKYGEDVKILPEPISIQCMYMDIKSANFLAYQLNTLELENDEGIKNQAWIDEPADFYSDISEVNLLTDYNPEVFPKMLALHINGLLSH